MQTIKEYNAAVQPGEYNPTILDGKHTSGITPPKSNWALPIDTPPFLGFAVTCGITFTFGGLRIDTRGQVLDTEGNPIPGLYAAGENSWAGSFTTTTPAARVWPQGPCWGNWLAPALGLILRAEEHRMALHIIVTAKQVSDPEMPISAYSIDAAGPRVVTPATFQPVINGFDENALEAALRLKDSHGATITVVSVGGQFALDIMKKALGMGADNLILCQDPLFAHLSDSFVTAQVLSAAIRKIGSFDLILCGRQASDWDNAQVPLMLAELSTYPVCRWPRRWRQRMARSRWNSLCPMVMWWLKRPCQRW